MKKLAIAVLAFTLIFGFSTAVFAKTTSSGDYEAPFELDGAFGFGTGPGDFGAAVGVNFGAGYMLSNIDRNLQARIDISYFDFTQSIIGTDLDFTRVPFTVSARYYFPINSQLKVFAQGGIETSFDSRDKFVGFFGPFPVIETKNEVNWGLSAAGGIEFFINPNVSIFALGRAHLISDDYFTMQFGGAVHF